MRCSAAGLAALTQREGLRLRAYRDSVGILTIGVGHTGRAAPPPVKAGMTITRARALEILAADLGPMEQRITAALKRPVPQGAFDALCSLTFNIGLSGFLGSTTLRKLNAGDVSGAATAMLLWRKPPELIGRRRAERTQFLKAYAVAQGAAEPPARKPAPALPPSTRKHAPAPAVAPPRPPQPALPPITTKPESAVMKNRVPFLIALLLALFGVSAASAAEVDFGPLVNAGVTYFAVPVLTALASWVAVQAGLLVKKVAARYPAYLDQRTADLLASNVNGVLDKAIAYGAAQVGTLVGRADLATNVDGWIASYAAKYAVEHAPDLMKQAGDITQKLAARLGDHPAVLDVKAQIAAAPALAHAA